MQDQNKEQANKKCAINNGNKVAHDVYIVTTAT